MLIAATTLSEDSHVTFLKMMQLVVLLFCFTKVESFVAPTIGRRSLSMKLAPVDPASVMVCTDADAVGSKVRSIVEEAAQKAIDEKGHFALAIPGGSILKMLVGCKLPGPTTMAYVNHKCVSMDDAKLATHAKAKPLFLDEWTSCEAIIMDGTDDGPAEAAAYEAKLKALSVLPTDEASGWPQFDLMLIGVGDDGHVGSLYPNRPEVLSETKDWVLPVDMKSPPSITLSLPVMTNAKQVVIAACGVSEKYPKGKSDAMRRAIADEGETIESFPASGLRDVATWILDEQAAAELGEAYRAVTA